ncbi:MAG: c-type cytochrome [Bacteroidales bacterium]|nr:c-type cytochrome [Bacteroidales bacterium]
MKYSRLLFLFLVPLLMMGCKKDKNNPGYNYMGKHDMYYTKFYKAYSPNPLLPNGMTNQMPAEGAVARGKMPFPYKGSTITDRAQNQSLAGLELANPITSNDAIVQEGKEQFRIFCSNCHGLQARGDGNLYTSKLFPAKPTSLVESYVQNKPDGEIYYVITMGSISGLMGPHGSQITPENRWKIIHYLRHLAK